MDGTRMGSRSSTRHGPASVFSGPVRRWKKTWAPISSSNPSPVASRVLLYKWLPLTPGTKDENVEEPTTRPIRYLPLSVVLAQRKDAARRAAEEAEAAAQAILLSQQTLEAGGDSAPDPMDSADQKEYDVNKPLEAQDLSVNEKDQGQAVADAREGTQRFENSPVAEQPMEVESKSADGLMQDQTADEQLSSPPCNKNEEKVEVLSDTK